MKKKKIVQFASAALAAVVLATGSWYVSRETEDLSLPQAVEFIDTEDGSVVIPQEEVPLASKPTVKVKKTKKKTVKRSKLKKKAKKTVKTTKRSTKSKSVKKESSTQKVVTDTTIKSTVVSATKKNSKVKTVTTTVETTIKTTTTSKPKSTAKAASAPQNTAAQEQLQVVNEMNIRTLAPKADSQVLKAFETLEFKLELNPSSSYTGYFSVQNHMVTLKNRSGNTIYHELGHFVGWLAGNVDRSSEFVKIYQKEKDALKSANYKYLTSSSEEYFAESYKEYILTPQDLKSTRPETYAFMEKAVSRITDARVSSIKTAYMKTYWA